jgi:ribosomal protein S27AE
VRDGTLVKLVFCEHCGNACFTVAHHEDYSRPLYVDWLCGSCHRRAHGLPARRLPWRRPDPFADLLGELGEGGNS